VNLILGRCEEHFYVFEYVGGELAVPEAAPVFHSIDVGRIIGAKPEPIIAKIRLFSFLETPIYYAIPGFVDPSN